MGKLLAWMALVVGVVLSNGCGESEAECVQEQCLTSETAQYCSGLVAGVCNGTRGIPVRGKDWLATCGDSTGADLCAE
jgi:hypothetical protein